MNTKILQSNKPFVSHSARVWIDDYSALIIVFLVIPTVFTAIWLWSGLNPFTWDAPWYRSIASSGLQFDGNILRKQNVAFLPGYPSLIFLFHSITGVNVVYSQYFVSLFCYLGGNYCMYRMLCTWFRPRHSALTILIFSLNPFSIYLLNGYSESLFYLLCSIFFLGASTDRLWISSIALSFALVTRPHAVSLYPVLIYKLAKDHWPITITAGDGKINRLRVINFFQATVNQLFLTLIFPMILTFYWYFKFSDPLVYLNALTAWGGVGSSGIKGQLEFLIHHLTHFHVIAKNRVALLPGGVMSPSYIASINVLANVFALIYLVRQRKFELALFCGSLLIFWFLKSVPQDSGRHALFLLAMPVAVASLLMQPVPLKSSAYGVTSFQLFKFWTVRVLVIGFLLFSFAHFSAFALIQLEGGWIS